MSKAAARALPAVGAWCRYDFVYQSRAASTPLLNRYGRWQTVGPGAWRFVYGFYIVTAARACTGGISTRPIRRRATALPNESRTRHVPAEVDPLCSVSFVGCSIHS